MAEHYRTQGYVVFRQIIPPSLLSDLRKAAESAQEKAREKRGPQVQRLQPIADFGIDMKPFWDYAELPALTDAIAKVLTPRHRIANSKLERMGLLLEPAEKPWCTTWHRDIQETSNVPDVEEFRRVNHDPLFFNQINCPLYEDNCTWYVPGSYLREDLPEEPAAAEAPLPPKDSDYETLERGCLDYTQSMPGAIRLSMDAGDFVLYHPNGWHTGNYLPDRRRATIHDFAPHPDVLDWYDRWEKTRFKDSK